MANSWNKMTPLERAHESIRILNNLTSEPWLGKHFIAANGFYAIEENGEILFAFSKFIGAGILYKGARDSFAAYYSNKYNSGELDGVGVKSALKDWMNHFEEVHELRDDETENPEYQELYAKLLKWLGKFHGKGPRKRVRLFRQIR